MTHNFFLNLMSLLFPLLCIVLTFVPADVNQFINVVARWFYRRFNTPQQRQQDFHLNETALRIFGIIGLLFSLTIISLLLFRPSA